MAQPRCGDDSLFKSRGLIPKTSIAVRRTPSGPPHADVTAGVRPLAREDLDTAVLLWAEVIDWDNRTTGHPRRAAMDRILRSQLEQAIDAPGTCWVAETDGDVVGLLVLSAPRSAGWIRPTGAVGSAAYLGCLVTTAGRRGDGIGGALVDQAHRAVSEWNAEVTLLHYNMLNPLSGPFWHRAGYRPLWTTWCRPL